MQGNAASSGSVCYLARLWRVLELLLLSLHVARVASLQDDNACSTCFSAATLHATNTTRQVGGGGSEMIDDVAKY